MNPELILYKYRSWQENENIPEEEKFQKRSLTHTEVFFASPTKLNDPFDLNIPKRYDLLSEDQITILTYYHFLRIYPEKSAKELCRLAKEKQSRISNERKLNATIDSIKNLKNRHGILSLSQDYKNIIMWTHYANNHKGFCVGYNVKKLIDFIKSKTDEYALSPIAYSHNMPVIIPPLSLGSRFDNIVRRLTTKSFEWSYEKEFRLIIHEPDKCFQVPHKTIEEIIIGCNATPETEDDIFKLWKNKYPKSKLFKAKTDANKYKILLNPKK